MKKNHTKKVLFLFILSVPTFFSVVLIGMALIETEDWVDAPAVVCAENEHRLYLSENARLTSIKVYDSDHVKKGQVLAVFVNQALNITLQQLINQGAKLTLKHKRAKLAIKRLRIAPLPDRLNNAKQNVDLYTKEVRILSDRLVKYQNSLKKGSYSQRTVEDLEIKLAVAQNNLKQSQERQQQREQGIAEITIAEAEQEDAAIALELNQVRRQALAITKRIQALKVIAPHDAIVVHAHEKFEGKFLKQGTRLFTLATGDKKYLQIEMPENKIRHFKKGSKVRFESSTYSRFEYFNSYYRGNIDRIGAVSEIEQSTPSNTSKVYKIYAQISAETNEASPLPELPLGSTGVASISKGRRNLLYQLIGWN